MASLITLFAITTTQLGLPPNLLSSVCWIESHHNVHAVNVDDGGADSLGICQIKSRTARWMGFRGTRKQLMKPSNNILYAGKYLKYQIERYNGDLAKAVIAYNIGNAKTLTTTKYQRKVFKRWQPK